MSKADDFESRLAAAKREHASRAAGEPGAPTVADSYDALEGIRQRADKLRFQGQRMDAAALDRAAREMADRLRARQRGFSGVELVVLGGSFAGGAVSAPRLNAAYAARPLGPYVPPSLQASALSFLGAVLAKRYGKKLLGKAQATTQHALVSLGAGLLVGTAVTAKSEGGILSRRKT